MKRKSASLGHVHVRDGLVPTNYAMIKAESSLFLPKSDVTSNVVDHFCEETFW
jgi:hypothetical protein